MANSAARISRRGGPSPEGTGKRNTPASSRLYHRHQPSSSQARIFRRSPVRLRKTNQWPERGSSPRAWRTKALRPSNDLRRSTTGKQRKTRMVGDRLSMKSPPARPGGRGGRPVQGLGGCGGVGRRRARVRGPGRGRRRVVTDSEGNEGQGFVGGRVGCLALGKGSSPGIESGFGQAMPPTENAHGQAAVLPAIQELPPVLFLARVTGFALWHG